MIYAQITKPIVVNITQKEANYFVAIDYCTIFYFFLQIIIDNSENMDIIEGVVRKSYMTHTDKNFKTAD